MPVYFDCDTGVDDSLALGYLVASPEIELVGIGSVSGNIDAARAARNTLDVLALAGVTGVPVAVGAHDPLRGRYAGGAPLVHGRNGIGDVELPASPEQPIEGSAAELLVRLAHEHPGRLRVLAVGPFTNLALALQLEPRLPELVADVVVMGGAALVPGNLSAVAEANIANDPEAARVVLDAPWPVTLVPLDVTMVNLLEESDRRALLAAAHPLPQALGAILDLYFDFYRPILGRRCSALHDPLAAAILTGGVNATLAPVVRATVDDSDGPGRGQTICDLRGMYAGYPEQRGAHCSVVLDIDVPLAPHLMGRLVPTGGKS
ncbi:MAG: nucleoside hydrolase [Propionibacteriaceae bacterium]